MDARSELEELRRLDALESRSAPRQPFVKRGYTEVVDPTEGMSKTDLALAGAGKMFTDLGRGVAQMTPWGPSRQQVDEANDQDVPLMARPEGFLGNLGAGAAAAVPLSMLPGAGTTLGAGLIGSLFGAAQPVGKDDSRTLNSILGGAFSSGGKVAMDKIGSFLGQRMTNQASDLAAQKASNAQRDAAIQEAKDAGYKLTPNQADAGGFAKAVEGLSGSAKMEKLASVKNQKVTNNLVREELEDSMTQLGLPGLGRKNLSAQTMQDIRTQAGKSYNAMDALQNVAPDQSFAQSVQALSLKAPGGAVAHPAEAQIDDLVIRLSKHQGWDGKSLRQDITRLRELSKSNYSAAKRAGGDLEKSALAKAQSEAAEMMEDLAERNLASNGAPANLVSDFRKARQLMAKTYTVENALDNVGNVSARDLAKSPVVTGGMKKASDFAKNFEGSARDVSSMRDRANFSAFDLLLGAGGAMADPTLLGAAAARPAARSMALSNVGQSMMAQPSYNVPMSTRILSDTANNPMLKRSLPLSMVPGVLGVSE